MMYRHLAVYQSHETPRQLSSEIGPGEGTQQRPREEKAMPVVQASRHRIGGSDGPVTHSIEPSSRDHRMQHFAVMPMGQPQTSDSVRSGLKNSIRMVMSTLDR